jgi:hypothetical protein
MKSRVSIYDSLDNFLEGSTAKKVRVPIWPLNPGLMTTLLYTHPLRACGASSRGTQHTSRAPLCFPCRIICPHAILSLPAYLRRQRHPDTPFLGVSYRIHLVPADW